MKENYIPQLSVESSLLIKLFAETPVGKICTYDQIEEAIGKDPVREGRGNINTAKNRVLKDMGIVFECVRGIGYKRLEDKDILKLADADRRRVLRVARTGARKLTAVKDYNSLSMSEKVKFNVSAAVYAAWSHISRKSSLKKLEAHIAAKPYTIPSREVLDICKG